MIEKAPPAAEVRLTLWQGLHAVAALCVTAALFVACVEAANYVPRSIYSETLQVFFGSLLKGLVVGEGVLVVTAWLAARKGGFGLPAGLPLRGRWLVGGLRAWAWIGPGVVSTLALLVWGGPYQILALPHLTVGSIVLCVLMVTPVFLVLREALTPPDP